MTKPFSVVQDQLKKQIDAVLIPLVSDHDQHIMLIDPPGHSNVGDSAILLGELDYLRRRFPNARVSFFDIENYSKGANKAISQASIILLHGGGNFGDLYPRHHVLRLEMLRQFPDKTIIQLPQSICFESSQSIAETADAIAGHGNFHLLVRDEASKNFAETHFDCAITLCPDMAFAMEPIARIPASFDCFCLLRSDKEAAQDHAAIERIAKAHFGGSMATGDWLDQSYTRTMRFDRLLSRITRDYPWSARWVMPLMLMVRRRYAEQRLKAGIKMLSQGQIVIADRLHAHVICCLLDIEHYFLDSLDGKVSALHRAWTSHFSTAHFVAGHEELEAAFPPAKRSM